MHSIRIQSQNSLTHTGIPRVSRNTINRALDFFFLRHTTWKKKKYVMWLCVRKGRTISYKHPLTKPHIAWIIIKNHSKKILWKKISTNKRRQTYNNNKDNFKKTKNKQNLKRTNIYKKIKEKHKENSTNKNKILICLHLIDASSFFIYLVLLLFVVFSW